MNLGKWSVSSNDSFLRCGTISAPARIIYLDDHSLFRNAIIDTCIRPFFANLDLVEFVNGDAANDFIKNEIASNNKIDLFFTDINHPGLRGNELVKIIRRHESQSNSSLRIPIIIISMVDEKYYTELVTDKIIDAYLSKAEEPENITECMEEQLYIV